MIHKDQSIPCPVCNTSIPFELNKLLAGVQFVCPSCMAAIGLSGESKEIVKDTMNKLQEIKNNMSAQKQRDH